MPDPSVRGSKRGWESFPSSIVRKRLPTPLRSSPPLKMRIVRSDYHGGWVCFRGTNDLAQQRRPRRVALNSEKPISRPLSAEADCSAESVDFIMGAQRQQQDGLLSFVLCVFD